MPTQRVLVASRKSVLRSAARLLIIATQRNCVEVDLVTHLEKDLKIFRAMVSTYFHL